MTQAKAADAAPAFYRLLFARGDAGLAQVWFSQDVLDKYRAAGCELIRTNTVGRLKGRGGWLLDFGIADDAGLIHASVRDLVERLPEGERDHWAAHVAAPAVSPNFLAMRLHPMSCLDDGDARRW